MKITLLEIVQEIMSDMDTDEVNSIFDTVEAEQIASIVKRTYINLISTRNWPHLSKLIQFNPITDYDKPTHLRMPSNIKELQFLNYDIRKQGETKRVYTEMTYLEPIEFLFKTNNRDSDNENIILVDNGGGVELLIDKSTRPRYWTSFNDQDIVFDSYDETVDTVMQNSKVQAKAYMTPTWVMDDDFVPDFPAEAFSNLVEDAKSTAFLVLKQMANGKAEANAQRQARWLSRKSWTAKGGIQFAKFGRRGKGFDSQKDPTFRQDN
jgi:hypothetical protein